VPCASALSIGHVSIATRKPAAPDPIGPGHFQTELAKPGVPPGSDADIGGPRWPKTPCPAGAPSAAGRWGWKSGGTPDLFAPGDG
jgi:hypothetical protein